MRDKTKGQILVTLGCATAATLLVAILFGMVLSTIYFIMEEMWILAIISPLIGVFLFFIIVIGVIAYTEDM